MQRLLTLVFLLCLAVPAGISISGCTRNPAGNYCNGEGFGLKLTDVASIDLEPRTTGISLAFGQTIQVATPTAKTCKGNAASVSSYTYGTTNNQLVDFSPTGNICAGVWNRRSGGGIPDFTTCLIPSPLPTTNGLPYATAFITATGAAITSNQVQVFVHAQVTAVSLVLEQSSATPTVVPGCLSQTQTAQLDAQAFYSDKGTQALLCAPNSTGVSNCSGVIGPLTFASSNTTIATIDPLGVITAVLPGTTAITASVAGSGSSAGYFSTCPPASISVTLNGADSGSVTQGVTQNLTTTITDTKGATIQGLTLDYQSTNPLDISVGSSGAVTANFAGKADIYAVCQPTTCNPAPIDQIGLNQTGTPITSNSVAITTPGIASSFLWLSSPKSQYFVPVQLIAGTVGQLVKMPYFPNSMVMDRTATSLYFGSSNELMVYSTASNVLSKEDPNVPGVVLAAAPDNQTILINDPIRKVFYLYKTAAGTFTTFSGVGTAAQWTPDAKTLYVTGSDINGNPKLFVNNINTGWTTYSLANPSTNLAITIPGVGAFLSGTQTVAHAWCPDLTTGLAYPQAALVSDQTDALGATVDGDHIIGASRSSDSSSTVTDIGLNIPDSLFNGACSPPNTTDLTGINFAIPGAKQAALNISASAIDQVLTSPSTDLTFVTYQPSTADASETSTTLPYYTPSTPGTLGSVNYLSLTGTAPVAGAFSLDGTLFFVSTAGDNLVHYIDVTGATPVEEKTPTIPIKPGLVDANGNPVPALFIAVKPRTTT
jgi:hypothetical protein